MPTKQDYIEAINEKFEDRLGKASKSENKKGAGATAPDSDGVDGVSTTEE